MTAPLKVLCVDDNPDAALMTAEMLRLAGCDVRTCTDGTTALTVAEEFGPDVCVIDLTMPGMDGAHLAKHLREWVLGKEVRLIALTGRWDVDAQHLTHNVGFDDHLVKPAPPDRIIAAVLGTAPVPA
jgi:CheY-like chemotaxis protein